MKLSEYVKQLSKMLEEHPHLADAEVCYASDDEGETITVMQYLIQASDTDLNRMKDIRSSMQSMNTKIPSLLKCIKTSSFLSS